MCLPGLRRRASERPDSSCSRKSRRVCPVLIESYVKIPAINSDASRKGNFLLYCAPSPRPKGRGLRGIRRSSRDDSKIGDILHGDPRRAHRVTTHPTLQYLHCFATHFDCFNIVGWSDQLHRCIARSLNKVPLFCTKHPFIFQSITENVGPHGTRG